MKLSTRHIKLLAALKHGPIWDDGGRYYRMGGYGHVSLRYNRATLPNMLEGDLCIKKTESLICTGSPYVVMMYSVNPSTKGASNL